MTPRCVQGGAVDAGTVAVAIPQNELVAHRLRHEVNTADLIGEIVIRGILRKKARDEIRVKERTAERVGGAADQVDGRGAHVGRHEL